MTTLQIRVLAGALVASTILSPSPLRADSRIEFKVTEGGTAAPHAILVGQGKYRYDFSGGATGADPLMPSAYSAQTVIVDPAAKAMIFLDHSRKTFTRVGRAELEQLVEDVNRMRKQVEDQFARMPPSAGAQAKHDLQQLNAAMRAEMPMIVDGGPSTVAGLACRVLRIQSQGQLMSEDCLAEASVIDVPPPDRDTLVAVDAWRRELEAIFLKLSGQDDAHWRDANASILAFLYAFFDLPLRITLRATTLTQGVRHTVEFAGVTSGDLSADVFAAPKGYKKEKLPTLGKMLQEVARAVRDPRHEKETPPTLGEVLGGRSR